MKRMVLGGVIFAILMSILLLLVYIFFSLFTPNIIFMLALILIVFSFAGIVLGGYYFYKEWQEFEILDFSLIALFSSFLFSVNYIAMIIPPILYYFLPGASGFTFYLPCSIFYGAFKGRIEKRGSSFLLMTSYGILSEIFFPSLFWLPYYLAWGGFIEIHSNFIKLDDKVSRFLHGFIFGCYGAGLASLYMLVGWGLYKPIFIVIPAIIIDAILSSIGLNLGFKIGTSFKYSSL